MFKTFLRDESGAVTVDWVVLTAALVGTGLAVAVVVSSGTKDLATDVDEALSTQLISTSFPGTSGSGGGDDEPDLAFTSAGGAVILSLVAPYCPSGSFDRTQSISGQGCEFGYYQVRSEFTLEDGSVYRVYTLFDVEDGVATLSTDGSYTQYNQDGTTTTINASDVGVTLSAPDQQGFPPWIDAGEVPEEILAAAQAEALVYDLSSHPGYIGGL